MGEVPRDTSLRGVRGELPASKTIGGVWIVRLVRAPAKIEGVTSKWGEIGHFQGEDVARRAGRVILVDEQGILEEPDGSGFSRRRGANRVSPGPYSVSRAPWGGSTPDVDAGRRGEEPQRGLSLPHADMRSLRSGWNLLSALGCEDMPP